MPFDIIFQHSAKTNILLARKQTTSKRTNTGKSSSVAGPMERTGKHTSTKMVSKDEQTLRVHTGCHSLMPSTTMDNARITSLQATTSSEVRGQSILQTTGPQDYHSGISKMEPASAGIMHSAGQFNHGTSRRCSPSVAPKNAASPCASARTMHGLPYNLKSKTSPIACGPYLVPSDCGITNGYAHNVDDFSCSTSPLVDGFPYAEPPGSLPMAHQGSNSGYSEYLGPHLNPGDGDYLDSAGLDQGFPGSVPMSVNSSRFENSPPESHFDHLGSPLSMPWADGTKWPYASTINGEDTNTFLSLEHSDALHLPPSSYPYDERFD